MANKTHREVEEHVWTGIWIVILSCPYIRITSIFEGSIFPGGSKVFEMAFQTDVQAPSIYLPTLKKVDIGRLMTGNCPA